MAEEKKKEEPGLYEKVIPWAGGAILVAFVIWFALDNIPALTSALLLCIGIGGAVSFGLFCWGLSLYAIRIGNEYREDGIHIMEWSVTVLFATMLLGVLLRIVERFVS